MSGGTVALIWAGTMAGTALGMWLGPLGFSWSRLFDAAFYMFAMALNVYLFARFAK